VNALREACALSDEPGLRSPLQRAEREEAIADWLAEHALDEDASESLAETGVSVDALDAVARAVPASALEATLRWAAAACTVRTLTNDIHEASMRISGLVLAVKGFTHMDQAAVAEAVDLGRSLANTVAVLRSKARSKSVTIAIDLPADLPPARGFVGELNQIWANLIDNALDAIEPSGRIEVSARAEADRIVVRIVDDGPGIPDAIRERIFEPFFTTKPMGQGTGLGLDIVRRLAIHNESVVAVDSRPGRTEFRVSLPLAPAETAQPAKPAKPAQGTA
jgi:signal transduction histidine kinase